jgi:hypothetical protein
MKRFDRKTMMSSLLTAALVLVLVAAGCGGETEEAGSTEPAATSTPAPMKETTATEEPMTEAAAETPESAAEPAASEAPAGGVHGRVVFDGPQPERFEIETERSDPKCALLHGGEPVLSELRVVSEDGGVQYVFVYVKNPPEGDYPVPAEPAVLDQVGCMYEPHILGMRAGQTLNVKNSDDTTHNIRSFPKTNKPFNISQPGPGVREREFPLPETEIKIKCDFHPWMTAYVFSMDHPFYTVTDENGNFTIEGLPDGEYTIVAWHEVWGEQETPITVTDGKAEANFTYTE